MNRSIKKVVFQVLFLFVGVQTFGQDTYSQSNIKRIYNHFSILGNFKGELILNSDIVIFKSSNEMNKKHDFKISYKEIKAVRRNSIFLAPNRIYIYTHDGEKIKLFTYKRRKIIEAIRANMKNK